MDVVIIGYGRVGYHLVQMMDKSHSVVGIFNRSKRDDLPSHVPYFHQYKQLPKADLYIISVHDDAILSVAQKMAEHIDPKALVVHTSGSTDSSILAPYFPNYGVLYPLQTFSREKTLDYDAIPFFLTTSHKHTSISLQEWLSSIVSNVKIVTDEQRLVLHISAVFACNMTNALYTIASDLCQKNDLDFDALKPLIAETADKVMVLPPRVAQTGPAKREDMKILKKHASFLEADDEQLAEIYNLLSNYIIQAQQS